jgi:hypothetical protein
MKNLNLAADACIDRMPKMPSMADGSKHREAVLGLPADAAIYLRQMPFCL